MRGGLAVKRQNAMGVDPAVKGSGGHGWRSANVPLLVVSERLINAQSGDVVTHCLNGSAPERTAASGKGWKKPKTASPSTPANATQTGRTLAPNGPAPLEARLCTVLISGGQSSGCYVYGWGPLI